MARPVKDNLDYFQHENTMRNDPKIKLLRSKFGNEGYAIYNMMLEYLSEKDLLQAKYDDFELEMMSTDFNIDVALMQSMMSFFTQERINLLQIVDGYIRCRQLDNRSKSLFKKRDKDLNLIRKVSGEFPESFRSENHPEMHIESKVKISKESIEKIYDQYPRKVGKGAALKSIEKALLKVSFEILEEKVNAYAESVKSKDPQFIPHPATWFNQERWNDEIEKVEVYDMLKHGTRLFSK